MAKPQLENGHTQIANEILEKLARTSLSPNQWQVLLVIIRKTYGFHKKVDYIANFQIGEATGLCKAVVSRCLKGLSDMYLITRKGKFIGFQKDWEKWKGLTFQTSLDSKLADQSTSEEISEVSSLANQSKQIEPSELAKQSKKVSSCAVAQKKKETIQKKLYKRKYGEFNNVLLTDEEYQKLKDKFGGDLADKIETLSVGIKSKGYKYIDHYATILSWDRRDKKGKEVKGGAYKQNNRRLRPRGSYTKPEDYGT